MSIGTPNGILDITGATLRVSKMEFRQSTGFDTVLNNVARNTMLLMDETEQTTSNSWALKLPNAWVAEFHGYWASGSSGAPILFNFYNDSTSGTNGYTLSMNDTTISINYDGGSTLGSATLSSTLNNDTYRKVAVIFERSVLDVSVDGEHVFHFADSQLRDRVYDNNSGYVTFTHSSTDERKLKNLKFTNGDKWVREIDSSNIAYVGGNVGIGTTIPGTKLDVSGTVRGTHLMGDGSAISAIQSSNVSDFGSNVTRIGTLETDLGDNSSRITNLSSNLSDNSSRITALESGDISISGDKTFTGDIIFESNIHMNGGNVFVANTVNMTVSDPIIELGLNNIGTNDLGIIMTRPAANSNVAFVYDESDDILRMGYTLNGASDSIVDLDSNALAVSVQGALTAGSNLEVGTANLFVDTTTSNVGVGVSSPAYKLDVGGDINIASGSNLRIGGSIPVFSRWTASGSDIYRPSGNVGIGVAPSYTLDVDGDINFTGSLLQNGSAFQGSKWSTSGSDIYRSSGNVGIGTNSPGIVLDVGSSLSNPQIGRNYATGSVHDADKRDAIYFGRWDGTGRDFLGIKCRVDTHTALGYGDYSNQTKLEFYTWGNNYASSREVMCIRGDGNVGIGTSSPNRQLQIYGDSSNYFSFSPTEADDTSVDDKTNFGATSMRKQMMMRLNNRTWYWGIINNSSNNLGLGADGGGGDDPDIQCVFQNNGTFWTKNIRTSGNVGIGTASPATKLHIYDTSTEPTIAFQHLSSNENNSSTNVLGNLCLHRSHRSGVGNQVGIRSIRRAGTWDDQADMEFYVRNGGHGSQTAMVINSGGNANSAKVGIGTTNPTHQLHIGPKDNDHIYLASSNNSYGWTIDTDDQGSGTVPFRIIKRTDGVDSTVLTIKNQDGKVGIGTSNSPTELLHVCARSSSESAFIRIQSGSGGTNPATESGIKLTESGQYGFQFVHSAVTDLLKVKHQNSNGSVDKDDIMVWHPNGNVGIGTNAPSYKLHISAGDDSITWYGPNTTWSSYLAVGAASDKTVANNTTIAQCITTNGNLHLDAGHSRDIYMNHYSGNYIRHGGLGLASDDRLKSEEELITNATDTLLKLSPQKYLKKYTLRENETREPFTETGLIAQDIWYDAPELRHIVMLGADADPTENKPEAPVDGDIQQDPDYSSWGPNTASVNYDGLIAYLVKSNQELHGEIQALKARIAALENA